MRFKLRTLLALLLCVTLILPAFDGIQEVHADDIEERICPECKESLVIAYETVKTSDPNVYFPVVSYWTHPNYGNNCSMTGDIITAIGTKDIIHGVNEHNDYALGVAATCTEDGYTWFICRDCGAEYKSYKNVSKALGHDWGDYVVTKNPTCTEAGKKERTCKRCGEKDPQAVTIPALNHQWSNFVVAKEATCTEDGKKERTCSRCGKKEPQTIPALGHDWGKWETIMAATDTQVGQERRLCNRCSTPEVRDIIPEGIIEKDQSDLKVLAVGFMLRTLGYDTGELSETLGDNLLAALNQYHSEKHLTPCTGLLPGTIELIVSDYMNDQFDLNHISTSYLFSDEETGLDVYAVSKDLYASWDDGNHRVIEILDGLLFAKGDRNVRLKGDGMVQVKLSEYEEPCHILNESNTCSCCGYQALVEEATDFPLDMLTEMHWDGFMALKNNRSALLFIQNISPTKSPLGLTWDPFEGAAKYHVYYYAIEDGNVELVYEDTDKSCDYIIPGMIAPGNYKILIWAVDENDKAISGVSRLMGKLSSSGPLLTPEISYDFGVFSWSVPNCDNATFDVLLEKYNPHIGWRPAYQEKSTTKQSCNALSIFDQFSSCKFRITVKAYDPSGNQEASPNAVLEVVWKRPAVYQAIAPVNVRSGPGTEYERIGGIKKGDVYEALEEQNGFIRIAYQGGDGWVMKSALQAIKGERFEITLVDSYDNDHIEVVETAYDGRLTNISAEIRKSFCEPMAGRFLQGWSTEKLGKADVDLTARFTKDTTIFSVCDYSDSAETVKVTYILQDGSTYREVEKPVGTSFDNLFRISTNECAGWYTEPESRGTLMTGRSVNKDLTVYAGEFPWKAGSIKVSSTYDGNKKTAAIRDLAYSLGKYQVSGASGGDAEIPEGTEILYNDACCGYDEAGYKYYLAKIPEYEMVCYIRAVNISFRTYRILLNPNGGYCSADTLTTTVPDYEGANARLESLPTPVKYVSDGSALDGQPYIFLGWFDGDRYVDENTSFSKETTLTARWAAPVTTFTTYKALVTSLSILYAYRASGDEIADYTGGVCEARVIDEREELALIIYEGTRYWIKKEDLITEYGVYTAHENSGIPLYDKKNGKMVDWLIDGTTPPVVYVIHTEGDWSEILFANAQDSHQKTILENDSYGYRNNYRAWVKNSDLRSNVTVRFDYNDGSHRVLERQVDLSGGFFYSTGIEPSEVTSHDDFLGWFTGRDTGEKVELTGTFPMNTTLYAHYRGGSPKMAAITKKGGTTLYADKNLKTPVKTLNRGGLVQILELYGTNYACVRLADTEAIYYLDAHDLENATVWTLTIPAGKSVTVYSGPDTKNKKLGELKGTVTVLAFSYQDAYERIAYDTNGAYADGFAYISYGFFRMYR